MKRGVIALGLVAIAGVASAAILPNRPAASPPAQPAAEAPAKLQSVPSATTIETRRAPVPLKVASRPTYTPPAPREDKPETTTAAKTPDPGEGSAKAAIEADGYKGVRIVGRADNGAWRARAMRGRTEIGVTVFTRQCLCRVKPGHSGATPFAPDYARLRSQQRQHAGRAAKPTRRAHPGWRQEGRRAASMVLPAFSGALGAVRGRSTRPRCRRSSEPHHVERLPAPPWHRHGGHDRPAAGRMNSPGAPKIASASMTWACWRSPRDKGGERP